MARSAFVVFCVLASAFAVSAQRTVTNADLEKFRSKRMAAERELRENYERMGFPSPEEIERQREESLIAREELARQLREERLERDRLAAEMRMREYESAGGTVVVVGDGGYGGSPYYGYGYGGGYLTGYGYPYDRFGYGFGGRGDRRFLGGFGGNVIWRGGPGGIIYEPGGRSSYVYGSPVTSRPRPMFRQATPRTRTGPIFRPRR